MTIGALPVQRGCGYRCKGGIYAECGLSASGRPLEEFLIDPPTPLPLETQQALGVRPIGVTLVPDPHDPGTSHLFDWIGTRFYPNVMDFLEEVRRFGLSRRLPRSLNLGKLNRRSRHVAIHANGWIDDARLYFAARRSGEWVCPKYRPDHLDPRHPPAMCAGLWCEDVVGGEAVAEVPHEPHHPRQVWRRLPSFSYAALCPPPGMQPAYTPAIVAAFPLTRLVVVRDERDAHRPALERAQQAQRGGIPVEEDDA